MPQWPSIHTSSPGSMVFQATVLTSLQALMRPRASRSGTPLQAYPAPPYTLDLSPCQPHRIPLVRPQQSNPKVLELAALILAARAGCLLYPPALPLLMYRVLFAAVMGAPKAPIT